MSNKGKWISFASKPVCSPANNLKAQCEFRTLARERRFVVAAVKQHFFGRHP